MEDLFKEPQAIRVVNEYLWYELKRRDPQNVLNWGTTLPFYPVNDAAAGPAQWQGKPYFIYNQAFRVEHSFYPIKKATYIYSMRADAIQTVPLLSAIQRILDRGDDAAKDINEFNHNFLRVQSEFGDATAKRRAKNYMPNVNFHSIDVYENEPGKPREGSSPPYVISNLMVVAKYHEYLPVDILRSGNEEGKDLSWSP